MKYNCLQLLKYDCGIAVIKSLLSFYMNDGNYLYLEQDNIDKRYSLYDLEKIALEHGLELESYKISDYHLLSKFPCLGVLKEGNFNHFIVINKVDNQFIYIFDPALGERIIELDYFVKNSNNIVSIAKSVKRNKSVNKNKFNLIFYQIFLIISKCIEIFLLFLLSFEIKDLNIKLLIYLGCFLFIKLLTYTGNVLFMKWFDKKYIFNDNSDIKCGLVLKEKLFNFFNKIYSSIMVVIVIGLILCINDFKNVISLTAILIIYVLLNRIVKNKNLILLEKIKYLENKNDFYFANKSSYKYVNNINYVEILLTCLVILFVMLICKTNNNYSPLLIYTVMYLIIIFEVRKIDEVHKSKIDIIKQINLYYINNKK